jgi:hypothetical protein
MNSHKHTQAHALRMVDVPILVIGTIKRMGGARGYLFLQFLDLFLLRCHLDQVFVMC